MEQVCLFYVIELTAHELTGDQVGAGCPMGGTRTGGWSAMLWGMLGSETWLLASVWRLLWWSNSHHGSSVPCAIMFRDANSSFLVHSSHFFFFNSVFLVQKVASVVKCESKKTPNCDVLKLRLKKDKSYEQSTILFGQLLSRKAALRTEDFKYSFFCSGKNGRKQFCQKAPQARPFCD